MYELGRILTVLYTDFTHPEDSQKLNQKVYEKIRKYVDRLIRDWMKDSHKIWCDKSIGTIENLELVTNVFPNASYICLHRHCLDFVHSALEVSKYGWLGYLFEDYIRKNPGNTVEALIDFWCAKTITMLLFEQKYPNQCLPVKYETIVNDPEGTTNKLFNFLGLESDPQLVNKIFSTEHQDGPGDPKIKFTKKIEKNSVGRGRLVPVKRVGENFLLKMNSLLRELNYEEVDKDWNKKTPSHLIYNSHGEANYFPKILKEIFEGEIYKRLLNNKQYFTKVLHNTLKFEVKNVFDANWLINFDELQIKKVSSTVHADCNVIMDFEILLKLLNKNLNIYMGWRSGLIEITGNLEIANTAASLFY
jgi:putative sterol carrier protein